MSMARPPGQARLLVSRLRPERGRVAVLGVVLSVAMLLPIAGPLLLGQIVDDALAGTGAVAGLALAYLGVTVGADLLTLAVTWWSVELAWRVGNRLRNDLLRHALGLDLAWHGEHSPGLLIERVDGDVDAVVRFASTAVVQLLGNAVLLVGVLVVATIIDWRVGLLLGISALVAGLLMARLRAAAVPAYDAEREVTGRLYGDIEERLGGLEDLRANGAGGYAVHRLHEHSARVWSATRRSAKWGEGSFVLGASTFTLGTVATLAVGVWLHRQGQISVGSILALFRFSQMIRQPVEAIADQMREAQKAVAGVRRAGRLLATRSSIDDSGTAVLPLGPLAIDLEHVTLAYEAGQAVLADVDLHVAAGTTLGIVGRTGSGKTSLGRLLVRFWDASDGAVRIGGVDVRTVPLAELRRRVGVVTQDVELFRASVRDNLTMFGTYDVADDRLRAVLDDVGLATWLRLLPRGLDTTIEGDAGLSAGEAQLVAFARVLLADPGLVLLDEATSRLDPTTEARVTAATERVRAGRTVVVIAHRLATLDHVDEICVLDAGRVAEHGPRAALADDPSSRFGSLLRSAATTATTDEVLA
jgi:ABC-type multidrug transport system fused ATPase/permease subunit